MTFGSFPRYDKPGRVYGHDAWMPQWWQVGGVHGRTTAMAGDLKVAASAVMAIHDMCQIEQSRVQVINRLILIQAMV